MGATWQDILAVKHGLGTSPEKPKPAGNSFDVDRYFDEHKTELRNGKPAEVAGVKFAKDEKSGTLEIRSEETGESEAQKEQIKAKVEEFNRKIEKALELEKEIKELGETLGKSQDEVIAEIVTIENGQFETPPLVRHRQYQKLATIIEGDGKTKEIKVQYDSNLSELNKVGEVIEALREEIKSIFKKLLEGCKDRDEISKLRAFINSLDIKDDELQILQRDKVEPRYKDLKDGFGADCVQALAKLFKMVAPKEPKEKTAEETKAEAEQPTEPQATKKVEFTTFKPEGEPIAATTITPEQDKFGEDGIQTPGLTEEAIKKEQKIEDIQELFKAPPLKVPTAPKTDGLAPKQKEDISVVTDAGGASVEVDVNNPADGGGLELNVPHTLVREEQTVPEFPLTPEVKNISQEEEDQQATPQLEASAPETLATVAQEPALPAKPQTPKRGLGVWLKSLIGMKNNDPNLHSQTAGSLEKEVMQARQAAEGESDN